MDNWTDVRLVLGQMIGILGVSSAADHALQIYYAITFDRAQNDEPVVVSDICNQVLRISLFLCGIVPRLPVDLIYEYVCEVISGVIMHGLRANSASWEKILEWSRTDLEKQVRFCVSSSSGIVHLVLSHENASPCIVVTTSGEHIAGGTDATVSSEPRIVSLSFDNI